MKDPRPKLVVTPEEEQAIQRAAMRVWETVAYDVFDGYAAMGRKKPDSIPRSHVMEIVMDANRLDQELRRDYGVSDDLCDRIGSYKFRVDHIVKQAFIAYTRWGL